MRRVTFSHGQVRMIYDDRMSLALKANLQPATTEIRRASHVESHVDGTGWYADLSPVGGPLFDGFPTRSAALQAEIDYIQDHVLPQPTPTSK